MIRIITGGELHGPVPDAHLVFRVREHFRDPHFDPALRDLTADDPRVRARVLATPGVRELINAAVLAVLACLAGPGEAPVVVSVLCSGGRHRAPCIGAEVVATLREDGHQVELVHRDQHRPVVHR